MPTRRGSRIRSVPRGAETFRPYPTVPAGDAEAFQTWLKALSVDPVSAVEWTCPRGWAIRDRVAADDMVFCILSGAYAGGLRTADDERPLGPGDMLLIPRGVPHWIRRVRGDCRMVSVHMHVRVFGSAVALSVLGTEGRYACSEEEAIALIAARLAREYAWRPLGWARSLRAGMEAILLAALRASVNVPLDRRRAQPVHELARLRPALALIESDLGRPTLRVRELAAAVHASEPSLRTWFRRAFGLGPVAFLRRERVARACALLRSTDHPIAQIAEACGFADVSFFHRVFRRLAGITPARYRQGAEE